MTRWNTFEKRIVIDQPMENLYRCWTTKDKLESWFLEKAHYFSGEKQRASDESVQTGDRFEWKWNNWDFTEKGEVLEANGKDRVSFTFGSGGIVTVQLRKVPSGTEITLIQQDIPTDEESKMNLYVGCNTGWTFWLTNLKAYLEHKITLHATGLRQDETKNLVNS